MARPDSSTAEPMPTDEPDPEVYDAIYSRNHDESPSRSVIETVAAVTGSEPSSMSPLYDAIDPEALDQLFDAGRVSPADLSTSVCLSFEYQRCTVVVRSDGRTMVSRRDPDRA